MRDFGQREKSLDLALPNGRRSNRSDLKSKVAGSLIEHAVASVFDIPFSDLISRTRGKARVALARQIVMYLLHVCFGLTLTQIGLRLGRDRTTVAHACRVVENLRDNRNFDQSLAVLEGAFTIFADFNNLEGGTR